MHKFQNQKTMRAGVKWRPAALGLYACGLALILLGCASKPKKPELTPFNELVYRLPGKYDNVAQQQADAGSSYAAIALSIVRDPALTIGQNVFYVRETAADEPRLVLAQYIWSFVFDEKNKQTLQTSYRLKEPSRWRGLVDHSELLLAMSPDDLTTLSNCRLIWNKTASGFAAVSKPQDCRPEKDSEGLPIEQAASLQDDELELDERLAGPDGAFSADSAVASPYHFKRRSAPNAKPPEHAAGTKAADGGR